tara:strand:+ start:187 stop:483 length:297 start_codon:yes stop_codon:yes gene_type:complete
MRIKQPYLENYRWQRNGAKSRSIEFNITYEEWLDWWGDDIELRGKGKGKLCMGRHNDTGAYELGNISKIEFGQNVTDAQLGVPKRTYIMVNRRKKETI